MWPLRRRRSGRRLRGRVIVVAMAPGPCANGKCSRHSDAQQVRNFPERGARLRTNPNARDTDTLPQGGDATVGGPEAQRMKRLNMPFELRFHK